MMYEELVKNLRFHADPGGKCTRDTCPYYDETSCSAVLAKDAADAIEELEKQLDEETEYATALACNVPYWIPVAERFPEDGKRCLVICRGRIDICWFAKDLYKVDKYDFHDKKKKSGFYQYDSEWGHFERTGITHWMPLPTLPDQTFGNDSDNCQKSKDGE